ncbi:hypothetical protein [Cohnella boryungensis]|jgi:hypothetical protein|uniref:HIG1 domain-containing protein n=1 Tax=Cohnella boryungensis TaxID=768479 RepID=A0ABV8SKY8_9BACL
MSTNVILILTLIVMAAGVVLTMKVGSTLGDKESNSGYSVNMKRKLGRLLLFYGVTIVAVVVVFVLIMGD